MKIKMEYVVLVALILALSGYLFFQKTDRNLYKLPVIDTVKAADISKISINRAGSTLVLAKRGDRWVVGDRPYPAEDRKVKGMTNLIAGLSVTTLISESKNYQRYDLDEENRIGVKAWIGDTPCRDFYLGKTASTGRHTFIILAGDHRVYHADGSFRIRFDRQMADLWDKAVLAVPSDTVTEITIARDHTTRVLTRETVVVKTDATTPDTPGKIAPETMVWKGGDGKIVDKDAMDTFLSRFENLACDGFIEDQEKDAFTTTPVLAVTLKGKGDHVVKIFEKKNETDKGFPAISSQSDYPFTLSYRLVDSIMKASDSLVVKGE